MIRQYAFGIVLKSHFLLRKRNKRDWKICLYHIDNAFENKYGPKAELPAEGAVALAGKKTQETLTATNSIIEALDMADAELKRIAEHEEDKSKGRVSDFWPNILMLGLSPSDFVLHALSSVHTNDLEQTLMALPFSDALELLSYLENWASARDKVELVFRVGIVLVQLHYHQLVSTVSARPLITRLSDILPARAKECKDTIGLNLAALDHSKQLLSLRSDAVFRDKKTKLLEIRSHNAKHTEARADTKQEKKRKKKQKKSDGGHVWS